MENILVYYVDEEPPTFTMKHLSGGIIAVIVVVVLAVVAGLLVLVSPYVHLLYCIRDYFFPLLICTSSCSYIFLPFFVQFFARRRQQKLYNKAQVGRSSVSCSVWLHSILKCQIEVADRLFFCLHSKGRWTPCKVPLLLKSRVSLYITFEWTFLCFALGVCCWSFLLQFLKEQSLFVCCWHYWYTILFMNCVLVRTHCPINVP